MEQEFSHFDIDGHAWMVDVTDKPITSRVAKAKGTICMNEECYQLVKCQGMKKGDVLGVARIAGIMGAKKTSELIPLCHIINLTKLSIDFIMNDDQHSITTICIAKCDGKTGVEMEALTGVQVALLTIYDMCKAVDKTMCITDVCLVEKKGGKSGDYINPTLGMMND